MAAVLGSTFLDASALSRRGQQSTRTISSYYRWEFKKTL